MLLVNDVDDLILRRPFEGLKGIKYLCPIDSHSHSYLLNKIPLLSFARGRIVREARNGYIIDKHSELFLLQVLVAALFDSNSAVKIIMVEDYERRIAYAGQLVNFSDLGVSCQSHLEKGSLFIILDNQILFHSIYEKIINSSPSLR